MKKFWQEEMEQDSALINLTPLLDVVFVVLISFILIAPLLDVDMVSLATGKGECSISSKSKICITIRQDDSVWLNRKKIESKALLSLLQEQKKRYPFEIPQVFADKNAHFGIYEEVKCGVEEAGFSQMDIVLNHE